MKRILILLLSILLIAQNVICSVQQAGQCLKTLENQLLYSSHDDDWADKRDNFISTIDQVSDISDMDVLLRQLRTFEYHVKYSKQTDSWKQWRRAYWRVMTDPDLNVKQTKTRFIIALKFMERSLITEAHYDVWMESKRDEWLEECGALVDPLLKVSFYDELFLNVDALLKQFGYESLEGYNRAASEVISNINSAARKLDQVSRDTGIADTTAGATGIASGILTGLGLVLAPFTAGGSLALTGTGIALGVGSAATSITSNIVQTIWDENKVKEVQGETESITAETMALTELLENYASSADDLKTELDLLGDFRALEYLKKAGLGSYKVYSGIDKTLDVARMTKIVGQIRPDLIAKGLGTRIALDAAAPGLKIPGWITRIYADGMPKILVKGASSLASAASKLSGFLSALSVGFGIWETINGANKIKEGSALAKDFRDLTNNLASAKNNILSAYDIDAEQAFEEYAIGTRYDNEGRSEEWHRTCFHGDMCVDLALLSYEVTGNESEQVCRRTGLYLLSVESQRVSDTVREFISQFGRSTWFSNASPYIEWAPGDPDFESYCVYFSRSNSFLVKDRDCNSSHKSAVVCA